MIQFIHQNNGKVKCHSDNYAEVLHVQRALSFQHPEAESIRRAMQIKARRFGYEAKDWDGYVRFFDKNSRTFPLGFSHIVKKHLKKNGIEYKTDIGEKFVSSIPISDKLRPYQKPAVEKFFKHRHGIIQIPTRGGKTFVASEIIRHIIHNREYSKILFFTDTEDLYNQAREDISNYLEIPIEHIGEIKGEKFTLKQVTVCTIQTITSILNGEKNLVKRGKKNTESNLEFRERKSQKRSKAKLLKQYLNEVTFPIIDEFHEYSSDSRLSVLRMFENAEFKLFISATPDKSQSLMDNLNLRTVSGGIIYKIKEADLKEQGYLSKDKVVLIYIDHNENKNINASEYKDFHECVEQVITHNVFRNYTMLNVVEMCRKYKLKSLVLFNRKKHGYFIKSITNDPFISGDMIGKERTFLRKSFLRKKGGVLLASDVFKKGITLPEVQVLVNAAGGLEQSLITQRKGRVLGVTEDKTKAMIIDFIDDYEYFDTHSLSRIEVYEKSVGKENITVLMANDKDFYRDFKAVVSGWFNVEME